MGAAPWTRIAPTPSGFLHAGNAVSFLITRELAVRFGIGLRLRIDDLDSARERPEYVQDIFDSLAWLGMEWDAGPRDAKEHDQKYSQRYRVPVYLEHLALLKEQGDLYACTCSRGDLRRRNCSCRQRNLPLQTPDASWRFHLPEDALVRMRGFTGVDFVLRPAGLMSDPVLRQRQELGGQPAYQLACVVDDADHGTTMIVRGEDLLPSTACQLYLAERLGLEGFRRIRFVHHPLITDEQGNKLSKSEGASALRTLRQNGVGPGALEAQAATILQALLDTQSRP